MFYSLIYTSVFGTCQSFYNLLDELLIIIDHKQYVLVSTGRISEI